MSEARGAGAACVRDEFPRPRGPRLTIRRLMVAVAILAVLLGVWSAWFDPARRWRRAVADDEDSQVRWQAIDQMAKGKAPVDPATALGTLVDALDSPSFRVRESALAGLAGLGSRARPALAPLLRALSDPTPHLRAQAAYVLVKVLPEGDPARADVIPTLTRMLADRSPSVRLKAAFALVEFGWGGDTLPVLIEAVRRPDYLEQGEAVWLLGRLGPGVAGPAIPELKALESRVASLPPADFSRYLRVYSAEARHLLDDPDGISTLRALAAGTDVDLARESRRVLARLPVEAPVGP